MKFALGHRLKKNQKLNNKVYIIANFQEKIKKNNQLLDNIEVEKSNWKKEIWRFVIEELKPAIAQYEKKVSGYNKGIASINTAKIIEDHFFIITNHSFLRSILRKRIKIHHPFCHK